MPDVQKVKNAFFDPFEYLMLRHKEGKLKTDFKQGLGKVAYHAACHQRVQNIGPKTREACPWCRIPRWTSSSAAPATTAPMP
jgi:glycerol-3-phosphate dehydrogenase subunit C